ncbi:hypothetical protein SAMN04487912_104308 [Arthrobacter sp. cf158]|nr:hypothetical protein SAMN04487912_104308 [Arthrobacter sp. cf158]
MVHPVAHRTAGSVPKVLRVSSYLWLASAILACIQPVALIVTREASVVVVLVGGLILLLFTVIQIRAALGLLRGQRWARVVLSILAVLALGGVFNVVLTPLTVGVLILTFAGSVLMWMPASIRYFRQFGPSRGQDPVRESQL